MNCAPRREDLEAISRSEPVQLLEEERLRKEIAELRAKIERVPFIDTFDLRYKITKTAGAFQRAVMFCLMDVSGSMDQSHQRHGQALLYPAVSVPQPDL